MNDFKQTKNQDREVVRPGELANEIIQKLRENMDRIKSFGVKRIGIFGSVARGEDRGDSDIDIIVEFSEPIGLRFFDLIELLEKILGRKVDLVSYEAISPYIKPYIEKEVIYI